MSKEYNITFEGKTIISVEDDKTENAAIEMLNDIMTDVEVDILTTQIDLIEKPKEK